MYKTRFFLNLIVILTLIFVTFGTSSITAQAGKGNDELKADPRLLQMAEENPDAVFMVIVQKEAKNKDLKDMEVEDEVIKGGGQVRKQLDLIVSFSAELTGKEITKLAKHPKVRWISADAPMVSTAAPGMETVRDEFSSTSYSGNNGTRNWKDYWKESGESDGTGNGILRVYSDTKCANYKCLRLGGNFEDSKTVSGVSIYRVVDLKGAASAFLTFNYRRSASRGTVKVTLSASSDGVNWTNLAEYKLISSDYGQISQFFDLTKFISDKTQIRFLVSGQFAEESSTYLYIDNVEIAFAYPSAFLSAVKADQLSSLNGSGVTVAVIDSGISTLHSDLKTGSNSRIIASEKFGDFTFTTEDLYGHGTHVAGIIGGNGSASSGKYKGIAPNVNLISLKTSNEFGMTYESDVVTAMQWVYNNKSAYNIRVVNISMNSTVAQSYHTSPLAAAAEILWFNGVVVVVSAGNNGTADGSSTIYPPANDPFVITVGATEDKSTVNIDDDTMAVFSAYGVTEDGFAKPDLVAPGRNIVAPLGGLLNIIFQQHPLHRVDNYYFRMSGTSMSAPVVSGTVALLLQDEPNLTPDQVKYRLMYYANKNNWNYDSNKAGAGYLDANQAVQGLTTQSANTGITVSQMLTTGSDPITWGSVGWNSVGWNSVGWNSVGWNSVGWNSVGWNSVGWNTSTWDD